MSEKEKATVIGIHSPMSVRAVKTQDGQKAIIVSDLEELEISLLLAFESDEQIMAIRDALNDALGAQP